MIRKLVSRCAQPLVQLVARVYMSLKMCLLYMCDTAVYQDNIPELCRVSWWTFGGEL